MSKAVWNNIFKYGFIIVALVVTILLFVNTTLIFVRAWFTHDDITQNESARVAQVDIVILEGNTIIGGYNTIDHGDNFVQTDDVYEFTEGKLPVYNMPAPGSSVTVNLSVKNLGWAEGLVRILGFEIFYLETTYAGGVNEVIAMESEMSISNNSEVWCSQYVDSAFIPGVDANIPDADRPMYQPISYNWYLNRTLAENESATLVTTVTNNSISNTTYTKFYIRFLAEITVYESNAYMTGGSNPPFGLLENIPSEWTAWKQKDAV